MYALVVVIGVLLVGLLLAEWRQWRLGIWLTKPLASCGFIALALWGGALQTTYGTLVLVGLCCSWFGDVFLIYRDVRLFRAGLVSFLLGHVAYVVAFSALGLRPLLALGAALPLAGVGLLVFRWLRPGLGKMQGPVIAYIVVISLMVAAAVGAFTPAGGPLRLAGAVAFYLSDLFVARDRFRAQGFENRLFGLPLYYGGQVMLALSVAPG